MKLSALLRTCMIFSILIYQNQLIGMSKYSIDRIVQEVRLRKLLSLDWGANSNLTVLK